MKTLCPAYIWAGDNTEWSQALNALGPGDIAVINPASGPGTETNPDWVLRINQLHARNVIVAGYVATSYNAKPWMYCVNEAAQYRRLGYNIDAVFWDEIAGTETLATMRGLHGYSRSLRAARNISIFNPGRPHTSATREYQGRLTGSLWVTSEGPASTYNPAPWSSTLREAHLVYAAPAVGTVEAKAEAAGVGFLYVTPDDLPNPWDSWDGDG